MPTGTTIAVQALLRSRRSVNPKAFTDELIPDAAVEAMLEDAHWAPTHKKTEPWRFHVYSGAARQSLADFFGHGYESRFADTEKYSPKKKQDLQKKVLRSSHVVVIGFQRDPEERLPEWEEIAAVAAAVQNFWLSASARGYGGYWSSPAYLMDAFPAFAQLPEGERCLGFFYLGVPKPEMIPTSERSPLEGRVRWNR